METQTTQPKRTRRKAPAGPADQGKAQQAAAPAPAKATRKRAPKTEPIVVDQGKAQQAAAPDKKAPAKKKAAGKGDTAPAGSGRGRGRQQQSGGSALAGIDKARQHLNGGGEQGVDQSQGSAGGQSSGKTPETEPMRGGTKQVLIEYTKMAPRLGRESEPEEYPFGDLPVAKKVSGEIEGPSFFIPDSDNAKNRIAAARKRHKGTTFWTRREMAQVNGKGPQVMGTRVFKAPPGAA